MAHARSSPRYRDDGTRSRPSGHRIVEIGAVELLNHVPTGRTFHRYLNPERSMPADAFGVHGLSAAFLADKPRFSEIADGLLEFLGDSPRWSSTTPLSTSAFSMPSCADWAVPKSAASGRSTPCRWRAASIPARPPAWMRCAGAIRSISPTESLHGALKDARVARARLSGTARRSRARAVVSSRRRRAGLPGLEPAEWTPKIVYPTAEEEAAHRAFVDAMPGALWRQSPTRDDSRRSRKSPRRIADSRTEG